MVKKVIWSKGAISDRKEILQYWTIRNKSDLYSKKLRNLFDSAIRRIQKLPHIGATSDHRNIRLKLVRDYYIIYRDEIKTIEILSIWDCRQDPIKLDEIIKR